MPITIHKWSEIPEEPLTPLLSRQMLSSERQTLAIVRLKKGCCVPLHSHESEQITSIIEGALQFEIHNQTMVLRQGETMIIPSHVPHAAVALEDTVDLDIFSPVRRDWLDGTDDYIRRGNR